MSDPLADTKSSAQPPPAQQSPAQQSPAQQARARAQAFEQALPGWQRALNGFCENWIFAFVIAMALRHFFLEAYRIPTASMEPTLYGDVALTQADHVVVDKMGFRFTGPDRWGVTVFQYPVPEVQGINGGEVKARQSDGSRLDSFPLRPLLQRNFVKRVVGVPGDVFYIAHGDYYLRQDDGHFAVAAKPAAIQEALWLPIYRHGAEADYVPWGGASGEEVSAAGEKLIFSLSEGPGVLFEQPLRNLYVKPGPVNVRPRGGDQWQQVSVSLLEPSFSYQGQAGNIFDLNSWEVNRLTTADLDSQFHGANLNRLMNEPLRDVRVRFQPEDLDGQITVIISQGSSNRVLLALSDQGWELKLGEQSLGKGSESPVGRDFRLAVVDNGVSLTVDGTVHVEPWPLQVVDPGVSGNQTRLQLRGPGRLTAAHFAVDRDVHYTADGVMRDDRALWGQRISAAVGPQELAAREAIRSQILETRRLFIAALADPSLRERLTASMERRDQGDRDWLQPLGVSPETALLIPDRGYLLLGDNSPFSLDSRTWGWVPRINMRGQVLAVVFPRWTGVR